MFDINEKQINETEEVVEKEVREPEFSRHDFGWESLASVETSRQNQLISEVYSVMSTGDDERIEFVKKEWESLSEEGIDEDLEEKFKAALDQYEHRQERLESARAIKKDLIEQADQLKKSTDWNKTAVKLQELQKQWKEAGFAGQDVDQELWEKFRAINDEFFDARSAHFEEMTLLRKDAKALKEALIEEVEAIKDSTEWKETSDAMRDLMTRWKEAGFAGREHEDRLWEVFNGHRQSFYQKQREFFDGLRAEQDSAREKKEVIIGKAKALVESFNDATTRENMEALFNEWKEAGHSGRDHEPKLWDTFRSIQDDFYARIKNRDFNQQESRRHEIEEELELLDVRCDALEELNEKIKIKIASLEGQAQTNDSETLQEEIAGLKNNYEENEAKLDEYVREQAKLQNELNRIF
ncbi:MULTISPECIES: DUF349 domain-containing protein [unclassified Erysipelothrix]|uniref:DUF349 domain-containing protein n=1 Tax=unclassified Erysipelothrix TaxID=2624170 RepID=UPI00190B29A1|nr:DUF349 domain-containing protein [Erysipelothrix sp. strain 2 (EsS2-6-Brazil)]